ncbi:histidinol-phosphate transaminase [Methylotuvimicrobium sp. KM1]|uniref:histidinol-phosphate transaminase n=1 Tax=Methylotuvimicrobium sp. KM1 TaxID=3377707 RepID=UPI00384AD219
MPQPHFISSIFRKEVLDLSAYKVADAGRLIKLDAMENPYRWPEPVIKEWLDVIKEAEINRYPDPEARRLSATLKKIDGISGNLEMLLGNGSDEIIQLLLMALPPHAKVLSPSPGFVMYRQLSRCLGLDYIDIPLQSGDFDLDLPAMLEAIDKHQPSLIFLAYPNNPTGNLFSETSIRKIIEATPGLVVVDEAYAPFTDKSFIDVLGEYSNLLVMRTLSKLGLAGLRLGYIVGDAAIIGELNKIRLPYNINTLTQITAEFALNNSDLFKQQTVQIRSERSRVLHELGTIEGITTYPSEANFILFRTPPDQAVALFETLKTKGILIKNLSPQGGLLLDCLRVTIGTPDENDAFLQALSSSFEQLRIS